MNLHYSQKKKFIIEKNSVFDLNLKFENSVIESCSIIFNLLGLVHLSFFNISLLHFEIILFIVCSFDFIRDMIEKNSIIPFFLARAPMLN